MNFGLSLPALPVLQHNFTEKAEEVDLMLYRNSEDASGTISEEDEAVQVDFNCGILANILYI